jgi:DNA-binding MarR family transcriptional regulator
VSKASKPAARSSVDWLALDRQLCFALYSTSLAMTKLYRPLLEPLGLTYPQYLVMVVLWEGDGITVTQLGDRLLLDSGTLTPLLKRLESLGFLDRRRDPDDERRVRIKLTPSGRALRRKAKTVPGAVMAAAGRNTGQLAALTTQLQRLRRDLIAAAN